MAANYNTIPTENWSLSLLDAGEVVTDLDDINQCILLILNTIKGSDPLRPTFGTDINKWIDKPQNVAVPNIKQQILESIRVWETRCQVVSISHAIALSQTTFTVEWKYLVSGQTGITNFNIQTTQS